jgi:hypothetical protein
MHVEATDAPTVLEYLPMSQSKQKVLFENSKYLPAAQFVHVLEPCPEILPASQPKHVSVEAPTVGEYQPPKQDFMQLFIVVDAVMSLNVDAGQSAQRAPPVDCLYFPATQATHALAGPVYPLLQAQLLAEVLQAGAAEFSGHDLHVPSLYCDGRQLWNDALTQHAVNPTPENWFTEQVVQAAEPAPFLYLPASQATHAVAAPVYPALQWQLLMLDCPVDNVVECAGHCRQLDTFFDPVIPLYVPKGHCLHVDFPSLS